MINFDALLETYRDVVNSTNRHSIPIMLTQNQVEMITVGDMLQKYKVAKSVGSEGANLLKRVLLMYYLTEDEFEKYKDKSELFLTDEMGRY